MAGANRSGGHGSPFHRRRGLFLAEALLLVAITALAAGILFPSFAEWQEERRLDLAAAEVTALIRTVQADAKNGDARYPNAPDDYKELIFKMDGGRVKYVCRRGVYSLPPTGYLADGVSITPVTVSMQFQKNSFAGQSKSYSFMLYSPHKTLARKIIVAMYTGRVRTETVTL